MKLKSLTKEELETMSYAEIAEAILNEKGTKLKIVDIFKNICNLLELSDSVFENKVADFFEIISTDKNFIVLEKGYCDLRKKHTPEVVIEEEEEEIIEETLPTDATDESQEDENNDEEIFYDSSSDEDDVTDEDELSDFIVVDDDEEASM